MNASLAMRAVRWIGVIFALAVAAVLVYRGNTYADPQGPGMVAPTMCVLAAVSLVCTTVVVILRSNAADDYEGAAV